MELFVTLGLRVPLPQSAQGVRHLAPWELSHLDRASNRLHLRSVATGNSAVWALCPSPSRGLSPCPTASGITCAPDTATCPGRTRLPSGRAGCGDGRSRTAWLGCQGCDVRPQAPQVINVGMGGPVCYRWRHGQETCGGEAAAAAGDSGGPGGTGGPGATGSTASPLRGCGAAHHGSTARGAPPEGGREAN